MVEENEGNNSLTKSLGGLAVASVRPRSPARQKGKPDLMVRLIRLDNTRRIIIEVKNVGTNSLAPSLWTDPQNAPWLDLKMNGNGWAG